MFPYFQVYIHTSEAQQQDVGDILNGTKLNLQYRNWEAPTEDVAVAMDRRKAENFYSRIVSLTCTWNEIKLYTWTLGSYFLKITVVIYVRKLFRGCFHSGKKTFSQREFSILLRGEAEKLYSKIPDVKNSRGRIPYVRGEAEGVRYLPEN